MQILSPSARITPAQASYLLQEAVLFLVVSYLILIGGTFRGLVLANLQVVNAGLVGLLGLAWFGARLIRPRPFPRTSLELPLLLVVAAYLAASLLSIDPRRSLILFPLVLIPILAYYLVVDLLRSGWPMELFHKVLLLASGFIIALCALQVGLWYRGWFEIGDWSSLIHPVNSNGQCHACCRLNNSNNYPTRQHR